MCLHRIVAIKGYCIASEGPEGIICIYAPNNLEERVFSFHNLISFIDGWGSRDFVIFGNFNFVLDGAERWGVSGFGATFDELISLVDFLGLLDLPLHGSQVTIVWSSNSIA